MAIKRIDTKILKGMGLLRIEDAMSFFTHVSEKTATKHREINIEAFEVHKPKLRNGFIERQHELENLSFGSQRNLLSKWFLGGRPIVAARNSCEVIAVYNSMVALGRNEDENSFPNLLYYFEKKATILKGYFGTSILGVINFYKKNGYDYEYVVAQNITEENVKRIEEKYPTYVIMSYNNTENILDMIHTMSITREEKGFFIHNSYCKDVWYPSLYEAVIRYNEDNNCKSRPIIVIGVGPTKA